jgi:fatty-acyl-CoA synthase
VFNIARSLDRNADRTPNADAVIFLGSRITHAQLRRRVIALAAAFRETGVGKGDVVGLLLSNRPEFFETALAVNRLGAAFLPLNVRLAEPELEYVLQHAGAVALVTEAGHAAQAEGISSRLPSLRTVIMAGPDPAGVGVPIGEFRASGNGIDVSTVDVAEHDLHRLMYTSGTTSRPKGVPITFGNFLAKTTAHVAEFGISSSDRTAQVGPLYHVGAFDLPGIGTWWVGGSLVILPRFDAADVLATIQRERPTNIWLAPSMVNALLQSPHLGQHDTTSVRFVIGGGEKMPVTLIERLLAAFPNAWFADAYGLTETVSGDTFLDREHTLAKIGSVGKPVLNLDLRIVDDSDRPVPADAPGEILLRGPKVVTEYWNDPVATAAAFTADGWFRTGDIGHLDGDGYLYIDDRKKDMIVSGGENVATSEVERVLYEHPAVLEVAVLGMPDPRWGEVPRAVVVRKPGHDVTAEALIAHCRERIAGFKTPKRIDFLNELPRNPSGKILKRNLRDLQGSQA